MDRPFRLYEKRTTRMKILFLVFHGFSEANGISKKIHYQVAGLKANGHDVDLCYYTVNEMTKHRLRMINDTVLTDYGKGALAKFKKRIYYNAISKYIIEHGIQFVYVRSDHNANPFTIHFFNQLKRKGIKTVMEIPTYPYDQEYEGFPLQTQIELYTDKCFRKALAKQLNYIITFSDYPQIFGAPTIRISNGIDFNNIKIKENKNDTSKEIHFIGVAEVHYWHGYDRMIAGMGEYYLHSHSEKVYFHVVGGICSEDRNAFQTIVNKYNIEKYIIFHGQKSGKELDDLFERCDMAIGSLARHRSHIDKIKTLKNREYAARGIPFIYSETDDDFEAMPYILKVPADESSIDIYSLLTFYKQLSYEAKEIRNSIRHLTWKNQMKKVLEHTFNE